MTKEVRFKTVSSDGVITLIMEEPTMDFKKKIERDVQDLIREQGGTKYICVSFYEHINILNELNKRFDGMLDYDKIIETILKLLDRKNVNKDLVSKLVKRIDLEQHLIVEETDVNISDDGLINKSNVELLSSLAEKLMETTINNSIYVNERMVYKPLPVDDCGICLFSSIFNKDNFNVESISQF